MNIFKKNKQTKAILSVMVIMGMAKVAGLFREILIGYRYGTGTAVPEAFGLASQFPASFLDVFAASALTACFVPVFSGVLEKKGREAAFRLANSFMTLVLILTAAATLVLVLAAPLITNALIFFTAGEVSAEIHALTLPLLRIMLPTIILTGAAFSITGVLQAMEEFNAPAAMSLVSNIIIILYLAFFADIFGIFGLAAAFLVGWGTQILIQLPALSKKGFRFRLIFNHGKREKHEINKGLKEIGKLMLPVMVGAWLIPVNLLVNTVIAGRVMGVAAIRYANSIYAVMTGVLVLSVANVMFTRFSKLNAADNAAELKKSVLRTAGAVTSILLPLSAVVFLLAPTAIRIIFERGAFTAESTLITGDALRFFSLGMAGFGLYHIMSRAFFAKKQGKAPLIASLAAMALNVTLSLLLVDSMGVGGVALSSAISITAAGLILLFVFIAGTSAVRRSRPKTSEQRILVVTMGLSIGGAETHILELCRALHKRGVSIKAASSGGKYAEELAACGVEHFNVPLNSKRITSLFRSYFLLKGIISENDINIVHAHARIPAFICGILCRRLKIRFVTTAHWLFNLGFPYKLLTNWGDAALAVSEDIKDYLVGNYKYLPERIIMTVNGIDTEKFSPEADCSEIAGQARNDGINIKRIVSCCRMDSHIDPLSGKVRPGGILAALSLIKAAPELDKEMPGEIEIVIIGDGDNFAEVEREAKIANEAVGRGMVVLTGPRTDVNKFLSEDFCDLFINASRSAFEAMSAARPVILAGNEGYMGLLTPDKYEAARLSNFCCRGDFPNVTPEVLVRDVIDTLNLGKEELKRIGSAGREHIKANYSADRMARDALELYNLVSRPIRKYDAVLSGYYGTGNSGDEMILRTIITTIRNEVPGARIAVLCRKRPKETARLFGVKTVFAFNFFAIVGLLRRANLLISGGGTLITDITSTKSLVYYLFVLRLAKKCGAKTMIYASGIGPFKNGRNKTRAARTLKTVDLITLRDELSFDEVKKMGLADVKPIVTADAVFGFALEVAAADSLFDEYAIKPKEYFIVAIRSWKRLPADFTGVLARFADYMKERHGLAAVLLPMMEAQDAEISRKVAASSKAGGVLLPSNIPIGQAMGLIENAKFCLAMRLHAVIYAVKVGTPVIGLSYDPKVRGVLEIFSSKYWVDVVDVADGVLEGLAEELTVCLDEVSQNLISISKKLSTKAHKTASLAAEIICRNELGGANK